MQDSMFNSNKIPPFSSNTSLIYLQLKQNRTIIYLLGDSYAANNELISKALAFGLQELKEKGEI
jgi:hypothetical protein